MLYCHINKHKGHKMAYEDYKANDKVLYLPTDKREEYPLKNGSYIYEVNEKNQFPKIISIADTGIVTNNRTGKESYGYRYQGQGQMLIKTMSTSKNFYPTKKLANAAKTELTRQLSIPRTKMITTVREDLLTSFHAAINNDDRYDDFAKQGMGSPISGVIEYLMEQFVDGKI